MTNDSTEMKALLSGLRRAEVAAIAGITETKLANWHQLKLVPAPKTYMGKWRSYTERDTEAVIIMAALVESVGIQASKAAKILRERNLTLEEAGIGDFAQHIREYMEGCMIRARELHSQKVFEAQRVLEERKMLIVQRAIADLPSESSKVALLQDMIQSVAPEFAVPVLLLAAGSLTEEGKQEFLAAFLQANPKIWGNVVINTVERFDVETKRNLVKTLSASIALASPPGTRIERGQSEFCGVCVHGENVLLISAGPGGPAYAATLPEGDARLLLANMDRELARGEDPQRSAVQAFETADKVAVFIGEPNRICIGAGEQGAIVAELTSEDFQKVRNGLAECLSGNGSSSGFRVPASIMAESASAAGTQLH